MDTEKLMTISEACEVIGINRVSVHKAIQRGALEAVNVLGKRFVLRESAERYQRINWGGRDGVKPVGNRTNSKRVGRPRKQKRGGEG